MRFKPHSEKQENFYLSDKRLCIAGTGIQWGKSTVGVLRLIKSMFEFTDRTDNFLVTSPTYKILNQSTLPVFMSFMKDFGIYDKKNDCFMMHNGGTVWFRTGQNPDSVVGITNIRFVLADEAGLYTRYFWDNIQARSSIKEAPITIVTSPYSLNWLFTDYIHKFNIGDPFINELCHVIQAKSCENPYFPQAEYNLKQKTMDPRRFNMVYGGSFDKAQGLVYGCFDAKIMAIDPVKLPVGTRVFGGIDWGFTDPTVIKIRAVTEDGMHYSVDEHYQTQMHQSDILESCARLRALWNVEKFFADPSRADHISYLNQHGITCLPADNEIERGIERHYELIASGSYQIFRAANKNTLDEYETYHYPEPSDLRPDQNQKPRINLPVDQNNHCMDVERYITASTYQIGKRKNKVANSSSDEIKTKGQIFNMDINRDKLLKRKRYHADISL